MSEMSEQVKGVGVPDNYVPSRDFETEEGGTNGKQKQLYKAEDWGDSEAINSFCSEHQRQQSVNCFSNNGVLDNLYCDILSPPYQPCQEDITKLESIQSEISELIEPQKDKPCSFPLASLGILNNYVNKFRQSNSEKIIASIYDTSSTKVGGRRVSTVEIIRLAGEKFIQSFNDLSVVSHPFSSSLFEVSNEEIRRDVELTQSLLASAEKVGQQQFDRASMILDHCDGLSSKEGNTVQRLVYYFSEALRERIGRETGRIAKTKGMLALDDEIMRPSPSVIAFHRNIPFYQVSQFTGIQAIVENVADAEKVHLIDLEMRTGIQCTVLMQALAARQECPIKHLKITAIGMKSRPNMEENGKRLIAFAQSINLSLSFNVVMVADMLDLNENLFKLDHDEAIAVHSPYILWTMISKPDRLESLIRVMKSIKPRVMVVSEIEANLSSPVFVTRFIEGLFFYAAYFESMEDSMAGDYENRSIAESIFVGQAIMNIVAAEGEERMMRHVNINVWRAFFARYGMAEIELSMSSLYQASLVAKSFACGSSCTLDTDGKCLFIGWKGTPIISLSAWKFQRG